MQTGTAGLGKMTILALANHDPKHIFFSGRNSTSAKAVIRATETAVPGAHITFVPCDLASLQSVNKAAQEFLSSSQRLDVLICNAGVMALPPGTTKDGYEVQFGTNHLGHALLIKHLLPILQKTAQEPASDARIVILSSYAYNMHPSGGIKFDTLRTGQDFGMMGAWKRYGQSKLANLLYAAELARRYPDIKSVSVHPGVIATGLVTSMSLTHRTMLRLANIGEMTTLEQGVKNQLWAATADRTTLVNGAYYTPVGVTGKYEKMSRDKKLACELWEWTQRELENYHV